MPLFFPCIIPTVTSLQRYSPRTQLSLTMASLSSSEVLYQQAHAYEDKSPRIIAASAVCLVSAFLAVIFRFVSRWMIRTSLQADDYTIIVALVSYHPLQSLLKEPHDIPRLT